ncbi:MAG: hypothetical protein M3N29_09115 [Chloroflexota bacterium]|nr:hypothetical protein [Chloroflexota bacterium]
MQQSARDLANLRDDSPDFTASATRALLEPANLLLLGGAVAFAFLLGLILAELVDLVVSVGIATASAAVLTGLVFARAAVPDRDRRALHVEIAAARQAGWDALHAEIARSRRHGRSFVLLSMTATMAGAASRSATSQMQSLFEKAQLIQPLVRATDYVWPDRSSVYVLLAECDLPGARDFVSRALRKLAAVDPATQFAYAHFPQDAVTVAGLFEAMRPVGPNGLKVA